MNYLFILAIGAQPDTIVRRFGEEVIARLYPFQPSQPARISTNCQASQSVFSIEDREFRQVSAGIGLTCPSYGLD